MGAFLFGLAIGVLLTIAVLLAANTPPSE